MPVHPVRSHSWGGGRRVSSVARRVCGHCLHWRQSAHLRRRDGTRVAVARATRSGGDSSALLTWRATGADGLLWSHSRHLGCAYQEVSFNLNLCYSLFPSSQSSHTAVAISCAATRPSCRTACGISAAPWLPPAAWTALHASGTCAVWTNSCTWCPRTAMRCWTSVSMQPASCWLRVAAIAPHVSGA